MNKLIVPYCLFANLFLSSCLQKDPVVTKQTSGSDYWQTVLQEKLPLLGHRNWIVITDMAYPLQAKEGITTLYASEPYTEVLSTVKNMLDNSSHVYAISIRTKNYLSWKKIFVRG